MQDEGAPPWPSAARGWYLITVLMVAYVLSFIDRVVLGLLVQPIRADLGISDSQMSVLYGFGFAIFDTTLGLPIARLADQYDRSRIIAVGIAVWSAMTAACGLARRATATSQHAQRQASLRNGSNRLRRQRMGKQV